MQPPIFFTNFMSSYNVLFFNNCYRSPNQQIKPMDITLMNRKLKMKFYVKDKKRHEYFAGQIVSYDGVCGKYGTYFPSDGELSDLY